MTIYNRSYLVEDAASSNRSKARRYMRKESGMTDDESMQLDHQLQTKFKNVGKCDCKFMLGLTRMYMNGELNDNNTAQAVNQALDIATEEPYVSKLNRDLNGMSAQEFVDVFKDKVEAAGNEDKDNLSKQDFGGNKGYDIVLIDSFEKARGYSMYTDWCVTQSESAYNNYTKGGTFYFCLKKGFKNEPKEVGTNAPLDEYGLSMIAVSIYPDGKCNTITCRWNHNNGGNDKVMTTEELSKVIGENFYNVFKPVKRTITLGGKEYVIGVTESGYKALYDEQGNNILGDKIIGYEIDKEQKNLFGYDILKVKKGTRKNYLIFYDGIAHYIFDEFVNYCEFSKKLSKLIDTPSFEVYLGGKYNFAMLRNRRLQYLFNEWVQEVTYEDELSKQLSSICFMVRNGDNWLYVKLQDGELQHLLSEQNDKAIYDDELSKYIGASCFEIFDGEKNNILLKKGEKEEYLFSEWFRGYSFEGDDAVQLIGMPLLTIRSLNNYSYLYTINNYKAELLIPDAIEDIDEIEEVDESVNGVYGLVQVKGRGANILVLKNGTATYYFKSWFKDMDSAKESFLKSISQKNESKTQRLSNIITEMVMRKLR